MKKNRENHEVVGIKPMDKKILIIAILIIIIFALSIYLYSNLIDYLSIIEKKQIYAKVIIGENYGFDINGSALTFGMITPEGDTASREIILENIYGRNVRIEFYVEGNIKKFMSISENELILRKDEKRKISFIVSAPENTPYGTYDGNVKILIKNPIVN